jgi:hypothetical protein
MADELCGGDAFTDYVGRTYLSSQYFYQELWPSEETWADGDRQVVCMLDTAGETGSLRGVNR